MKKRPADWPRVPDSLTQEDPGKSPSLDSRLLITWLNCINCLTCPSCPWGRATGRSHPWCWSGRCPRSWGCFLLVKHHIVVISLIVKQWPYLYWYIRSSLLSWKVLKWVLNILWKGRLKLILPSMETQKTKNTIKIMAETLAVPVSRRYRVEQCTL